MTNEHEWDKVFYITDGWGLGLSSSMGKGYYEFKEAFENYFPRKSPPWADTPDYLPHDTDDVEDPYYYFYQGWWLSIMNTHFSDGDELKKIKELRWFRDPIDGKLLNYDEAHDKYITGLVKSKEEHNWSHRWSDFVEQGYPDLSPAEWFEQKEAKQEKKKDQPS